MKKQIKEAVFILLIFLVLFNITSCKNEDSINSIKTDANVKETDNSEEAKTEPESREIKDSLPEGLDFGGETLNLLIQGDAEGSEQFYAEEENGDLLNDAVYNRNRSVEERLNMKLNIIIGNTWESWESKTQKNIKASIAAGDTAYDLIGEWSSRSTTLMLEGVYMDIRHLPYLELSNPWWNRSILDEGEIGGKLLFAAGDLTTLNLTGSLVYYFNKKIQQEYNIPDLYQTVIEGKWTNDYLLQITKNVAKDLDGDGSMDENDLFGVALTPHNLLVTYHCSSKIRMTSKDENGLPVLDPEHEKISKLTDYLYQLLYESKGSYTLPNEGEDIQKQRNMFKNDQLLLNAAPLYCSYGIYRDMESDYGILPFPKFDEKQEGYYTRLWADYGTFMCVPNNCGKQELTGAFLEAAAFETHKSVIPVLYEKALKLKFMRDDMSAKMLDIIRDGIYFNFDVIYSYNNGGISFAVSRIINDKNNNYASWYEKNEPVMKAAIADISEKLAN